MSLEVRLIQSASVLLFYARRLSRPRHARNPLQIIPKMNLLKSALSEQDFDPIPLPLTDLQQ